MSLEKRLTGLSGIGGVMGRPMVGLVLIVALLAPVGAGAEALRIAMHDKGWKTFYVPVEVGSTGSRDFLVDTGSSYTVLGHSAIVALEARGEAVFDRELSGRLADGRRRVVPVYRVDRLVIGEQCVLRQVEVAVFAEADRPILGLSALGRASPFQFSVDPPTLQLAGCDTTNAQVSTR